MLPEPIAVTLLVSGALEAMGVPYDRFSYRNREDAKSWNTQQANC